MVIYKHALGGFSVRRTPRACHGACARLRPGRLRASHAVCLRYSTLEPAFCARKEESDNESVSTTERIISESFLMRSLNQSFRLDSLQSSSASSTRIPTTFPDGFRSEVTANQAVSFGFYATSRHCIPRLSPRNSNRNAITANNGAAANCSGRGRVSRWLLPADPPRSQRATRPRPPQSLSLSR